MQFEEKNRIREEEKDSGGKECHGRREEKKVLVFYDVEFCGTPSRMINHHLQSIDTKNTSHDDGNDILNHRSGIHNTHGTDTDTSLGRPIGRADI